MLTRRGLIKLGLYGGTAALHLAGRGFGSWVLADNGGQQHSPAVTPFQSPLPVPTIKQAIDPKNYTGGPAPVFHDGLPTKYFEITARQNTVQILPGPKTVIWGYDGQYPGPSISTRVGERIVVRHHNALPANTIVHRHGGHNPSASDGSALFSEQIPPSSPGVDSLRDFLYPNDDDVGATNWYHDHDIDFTGHNVYMGLAGFYLLDDTIEDALNLPGGPGDVPPLPTDYPFEMSLVFQDRVFDSNNQLVYNPFDHDGFLGDTYLVNGAVQPKMQVYNRKYRFHVLNGSNARFYQMSLSNGMPFSAIGCDGGFFKQRVDVSTFRLGMAERLEFILDFSAIKPGTSVVLNNIMQQSGGRGPDGVDATKPTPLMRFDVVALPTGVKDLSQNPQFLRTDLPFFDPKDATQTINIEFQRSNGAWQINGKFFDPKRIDFTVKLGSTVIWNMKNGGGGWYHPVHIHRNQFLILDRNGKPPSPIEAGLKDVFVLAGGDQVRAISKFTGDNCLGPYVFHCHNIEHEDMRMMGTFNVVA